MSLNQENFDSFGNDMIQVAVLISDINERSNKVLTWQCFYDVSTVTGEPIRSKTLKYVEHLANRYEHRVMS